MIKMDSKAQLTVDIITKVAEGKIDVVNAALIEGQLIVVSHYVKKIW